MDTNNTRYVNNPETLETSVADRTHQRGARNCREYMTTAGAEATPTADITSVTAESTAAAEATGILGAATTPRLLEV